MKQEVSEIVRALDGASLKVEAINQISKKYSISIPEAYDIQRELINKRINRGEKISGFKLGFTSRAKMEQMGVHDLIWGRLTNRMEVLNKGEMKRDRFIHPRVEPEIAYLIKKDIKGVLNKDNVLEYIDGIAPAIEIIDSRYKNFEFSLEDVIADNCSSSGYVIGDWYPSKTDVSNLKLTLKINNKTIEEGNTNAILGDPLESFLEASRLAKEYDFELKKGMLLLAGAATSASFVEKGDFIEAVFEDLGSVVFDVQ